MKVEGVFCYTEAAECWKKIEFCRGLYLLIYFICVTLGCTI